MLSPPPSFSIESRPAWLSGGYSYPALDKGKPWGVLSGLAITTIFGYAFARQLEGQINSVYEGFFQALVGGALLHVVVHRTGRPRPEGSQELRRAAAFCGSLLGLGLLYWMFTKGAHVHPGAEHAGHLHDHDSDLSRNFLDTFLELATTSAPALILAFTMAGLIQVFLPKGSVNWMARGSRLAQASKGVAFGLPLPICSCGVVPVYRSLANRGVPAAAGLAFLVATPELGIDAILLSWPLLGAKMTMIRIAAAALVAMVVAYIVSRFTTSTELEKPLPGENLASEKGGFKAAFSLGWQTFFDSTAPWIFLGLLVAAACEPLLGEDAFGAWPKFWQVPLLAALGMPLYVCASGSHALGGHVSGERCQSGSGPGFPPHRTSHQCHNLWFARTYSRSQAGLGLRPVHGSGDR